MNNDAYLALGSSCSLTWVRSSSVNCLQRSLRENMYGDKGWDNATKNMSHIVLFLRTSSSCKEICYLQNYLCTTPGSWVSFRCIIHHTVKVCSTFSTSARRRASSMKGSLAIPYRHWTFRKKNVKKTFYSTYVEQQFPINHVHEANLRCDMNENIPAKQISCRSCPLRNLINRPKVNSIKRKLWKRFVIWPNSNLPVG